MNEEAFLIRSFKFFDITNKGTLDNTNFKKAIEKVGVIIDPEVAFWFG